MWPAYLNFSLCLFLQSSIPFKNIKIYLKAESIKNITDKKFSDPEVPFPVSHLLPWKYTGNLGFQVISESFPYLFIRCQQRERERDLSYLLWIRLWHSFLVQKQRRQKNMPNSAWFGLTVMGGLHLGCQLFVQLFVGPTNKVCPTFLHKRKSWTNFCVTISHIRN